MRSRGFAILALFVTLVCYDSFVSGEKMDEAGLMTFAKPMRNSCLKKTGVDAELVNNVRAKGEFADDPKLKCFFRCVSVMMKIMNKKFEITFDAIKQQTELLVQDHIAGPLLKVTKACLDELTFTDDTCANAWALTRCVYMKDNKMYFLP